MKETSDDVLLNSTINLFDSLTDDARARFLEHKGLTIKNTEPPHNIEAQLNKDDSLISPREAARILGYKSTRMIGILCKRGVFRRVTFPGLSRSSGISKASVMAYVNGTCPVIAYVNGNSNPVA